MGFFTKTKKNLGWMAVSLQGEGICVAHVVRRPEEKPAVELAAFFPAGSAPQGELLETVAKELHAHRYHCTTVLAPGEYQLLSVEAPNVPPDELKTAIRWRLKDMLDFHVDDATIDVLDVPVDTNSPSRPHSMYAVAARNQLIQERQAAFAQAKVPLSVIDIPEMAQRNLSVLLQPEGRGIAFLSFDAGGGLLTVSYAGELYLSRRIELPLAQIAHASEEQRDAYYDRITLELQRSLDHFDRQHHFITIAKLVLAPLGELTESLRAYLAANMYVPVEIIDLQDVFDFSRTPQLRQPDTQRQYLLTLGAALRHEEKAL